MKSFFSKKKNKWIVAVAAVLILCIAGLFGYAISNRQLYLDKAVQKVRSKLQNSYSVDLDIDTYYFTGLNKVEFKDVLVIPQDRDTLALMDRFAVQVNILPLLFGEVEIGGMEIDNALISFIKKDSTSNYDFLFKKSKSEDPKSDNKEQSRNFADIAERISKQVFSKIPSDLELRNFNVSYTDNSLSQKISIPKASMRSGDFESSIFLNDHDAEWILKGEIDKSDQRMLVEVSSKEPDVEVPFLRGKYGLGISFDKLIFDLQGVNKVKKNLLQLEGIFSYNNLKISHRRISSSTIVLPEAQVKGGLEIAENYISLKDKSTIQIKEFAVSPEFKFTLKPTKQIDLGIHTGMFEAQHFFDAIPTGLFENLEGIKVEGSIAYDLDFSVNFDKPDDLKFVSKIDDEDLKVLQWGKADMDVLNTSFLYDAYDDSVLVRQFIVGAENPHFVKLDQIPYVLKTTVRNTEDPFFYKHNGFEEEAFKLSIATNIKEKKFKRGASTISMQLVKNVFLNRKKTLNRKFEEILLVWLMEASGRVNKDRLLEIYLNVIEWGKNVYGISEAADYYFKKKPQELNLGESLFLSSIIPRPKTGLSSFDYTGHLKPWLQHHFNTYGYIMNKMGELNNVSVPAGYGFHDVLLQNSLRPKAPITLDSTMNVLDEHEQIMKEMEQEDISRRSILEKMIGEKQN